VNAGLRIEVRPSGDVTKVTIAGTVDERADFSALEPVSGRVELNLAEIRRFNSVGVRFWMDAIRGLVARATSLSVHECSRAVIDQLNMIRGFLASGAVRSFHAPMRCEGCDLDVDQLFRTDECKDALPPVPCPKCGRPLELDDMEDAYLLFLREPTTIR
jgi:hypothetical protein